MNICFMIKNINQIKGSYRIWVKNLNYYFNKIGIKSRINSTDFKKYCIHIYQKDDFNIEDKKKINGIINPSSDNKLVKLFDFVIVGSIEEKESLIHLNKNIFVFPLIEKMYLGLEPKIHSYKKEIIIGYHGNSYHLNHMELGLKDALEELNKKFKIKLLYIAETNKNWIEGKPNINIEYCKWDIDTIKDNIYKFDIGIIPNISEIYNRNKLNTDIKLGKYSTDLKIRFKNKSNNGRLLVLAQCGIPIVADITPSNMHILGDPDNGFAVLGKEGWYNALYKLCISYKLRNKVSKNAYNEVKRLYDPYQWAKKLYNNIIVIKK